MSTRRSVRLYRKKRNKGSLGAGGGFRDKSRTRNALSPPPFPPPPSYLRINFRVRVFSLYELPLTPFLALNYPCICSQYLWARTSFPYLLQMTLDQKLLSTTTSHDLGPEPPFHNYFKWPWARTSFLQLLQITLGQNLFSTTTSNDLGPEPPFRNYFK